MNDKRVESSILTNGTTVIAHSVPSSPIAIVQVWMNGSSGEEADCWGSAHLLEHMVFRGTKGRAGLEGRTVGLIQREIEEHGGQIRAWTSYDYTVFEIAIPQSETELAFDVLSDMLQNAALDPQELSKEIDVVVEEIRDSERNEDRSETNRLFSLLFSGGCYQRNILGTVDSVRAQSTLSLRAYYRAQYRPNSCTIVYSGPGSHDEIKSISKQWFGHWHPPEEQSAPNSGTELKVPALHIERSVSRSSFAIGWHVNLVTIEDSIKLELLAWLLGGYDRSTMARLTQMRPPLVSHFRTTAFLGIHSGALLIRGHAHQEMNRVLGTIVLLANELGRLGWSTEKLDNAKRLFLLERSVQNEGLEKSSSRLGREQRHFGRVLMDGEYEEYVSSISSADMKAYARSWINANLKYAITLNEDDLSQIPELQNSIEELFSTKEHRVYRPPVESYEQVITTDTGAKIIALRRPVDVVNFRLVALGGQRCETPSTQGWSQLLASMLGYNSRNSTRAMFSRRVIDAGGVLYGAADRDIVFLKGQYVRSGAKEGLSLLLDAWLNTDFNTSVLDSQRAAMQHRYLRQKHSASESCNLALWKTVFDGCPYGLHPLGTPDSLSDATPDSMTEYKDRTMSQRSTVLVIVGDADVEMMLDYAAMRLSRPENDAPRFVTSQNISSACRGGTKIAIGGKGDRAHFVLGAHGYPLSDSKRFAMDVLSETLNSPTGPLYRFLREDEGLVYSVGCSSQSHLDGGLFSIHFDVQSKKFDYTRDIVMRILVDIRQAGISEKELRRAQARLKLRQASSLQKESLLAGAMAFHECLGLGYDAYRRYSKRIDEVSLEQITNVAQEKLAYDKLVQIVHGAAC